MPRPREQVLKATSLRDVIAAVPFQCGFHPQRSVVVLSLRGPRKRVGQVTRIDLPGIEDLDGAVAELAEFVVRDQGVAALVVIYDDQDWDPDQPPRFELVTALVDELSAQEVPAADVLYVTRARYWSYLCRDRGCCPPDGQPVADAQSSPIAAAYVLAGLAPLPDREALVARVHPTRPLLVAAVTDSAWRWLGAFAAADDQFAPPAGSPGPDRTAEAFAVVDQVLARYLDRNCLHRSGELSVDEAGHLVALLHSLTVRDAVLFRLCRMAGPLLAALVPDRDEPEGVTEEPDLAREDAIERLLIDLSVRVEGPLASAPLTVLAYHCWARGEGALARIAVDRVRAEDPTYRLAMLLGAVLDHGLAPDWVAAMRRDDERAS